MKTYSLKRQHRHGNSIRMRKAVSARAPPSSPAHSLEEAEGERRRRRRQDIEEEEEEEEEVISAPSSSSGASAAARSLNMNRRNSFEDFAALDTAIAGMLQKVQQMAQILQNAGNGAPCTSTSSIEQSVYLSETFESIQPLMMELQQEVNQGAQLFSQSSVPNRALIEETAQKLIESGEMGLRRRLENCEGQNIDTWQEMNSKLKVFSMQDRQVMSYMRHLKSQTPSALPIFPRHLDTSNTFILMGDTGVYFFARDFLCRGLVAPVGSNNRSPQQQNPEHEHVEQEDSNMFWYEASDTDDEAD